MNPRATAALAAAAACFALLAGAVPAVAQEAEPGDPWRGMNEKVHAFNEWADRWVVGPAGRAWGFVLPDFVEQGIDNLYDHTRLPMNAANDLLQLKGNAFAWDLTRFAVNSTFGIGGLVDVASMCNAPKSDEDFGQTLGAWGVPSGPFVMLPVVGPSNVRDTFGFAVDTFSQPHTYFIPFWASATTTVARYVNLRSIFDDTIAQNREQSFNYYVFLRDAYVENRAKRVADQAIDDEDDDDLYYFDDEEGFDE